MAGETESSSPQSNLSHPGLCLSCSERVSLGHSCLVTVQSSGEGGKGGRASLTASLCTSEFEVSFCAGWAALPRNVVTGACSERGVQILLAEGKREFSAFSCLWVLSATQAKGDNTMTV